MQRVCYNRKVLTKIGLFVLERHKFALMADASLKICDLSQIGISPVARNAPEWRLECFEDICCKTE